MTTISDTELARRTDEVLDQIIAEGQPIAIERNRRVIAQIVPAQPTPTARQVLAELHPMLRPEQARAWQKDSGARFDDSLRDPWI